MEFEFDPDKSAANKAKHGIDFVQAQEIWADEMMVQIPAKTLDERRFLAIGQMKNKLWAVVWTPRPGVIRIISARRARPQEVKLYEQN